NERANSQDNPRVKKRVLPQAVWSNSGPKCLRRKHRIFPGFDQRLDEAELTSALPGRRTSNRGRTRRTALRGHATARPEATTRSEPSASRARLRRRKAADGSGRCRRLGNLDLLLTVWAGLNPGPRRLEDRAAVRAPDLHRSASRCESAGLYRTALIQQGISGYEPAMRCLGGRRPVR